ncbi:hypothetical protein [Isoptericola variabilis]|uniref:Uncharacterized protein n=1 Tax=Isoptericola variabilis (strain 225) TaxID=743718 RepID=F6FUD8_ISOV2|nr:hypothetical protein [Isoptericola variabilis]AEG44266.1 hypothetical protein Isova_1505 [Isoptericola variabilis 225]TWH28414.1 hypothetical protein L600_000400000130 [Isoptericola variabilis J7]
MGTGRVDDRALAGRGRVLRLGVARDTAAVRHITTFLVVTVATVLVTRAYLAATGYPQIGGGDLHVAHVLWGGLLMAVAFVLLLSYVGPPVRWVGAVLGGVGFGLFVDEVGKFVTADNDYFYAPTAALIYATIVALVLLVEAMHGRRAHHPSEYLAVAADRAAAGLAGGFTEAARAEARALVERGRGEPGAAELAALVEAVPHDEVAVPDPVHRLVARADRWMRRAVGLRWTGWLVGLAVLAVAASSALTGLRVLSGDAPSPSWVGVGILAGAGATAACLAVAAVLRRGDPHRAAAWVRRGVIVSLLITQVLVFRAVQWVGVLGLVVDLVVFALLEVAAREAAAEEVTEQR